MIEPADATAAPRLRLSTRFGGFEADARVIVSFPLGIPGYEQCRQFMLLASERLPGVHCLHAVSGPPASFLVMNPRHVLPEYECVLSQADRTRLHAGPSDELVWLAVLTFEGEQAFANLRAPVVIHPARMLGLQVMPQDTTYPLRQPVTIA